jgi:hypothetical protein
MFRQPIAEQKLAAVLLLQEYLLPKKESDASRDLNELVLIFEQGHIADWNTIMMMIQRQEWLRIG